MGILRKIFGPSKKEIWSELSKEINAEFIEGTKGSKDRIVVHYKEWSITLDTYTVSSGKSTTTYTRMRVPYVSKDGLCFKIYNSWFLSGIGERLGMQDIKVGVPEFDKKYVIKGNDEIKVKALFSNETIRKLIELQPRVHLTVKDDEGWLRTQFPNGVDELCFLFVGVQKKKELLKALFDLFEELLEGFCSIGAADESNPGVEL